MNGFEELVVRRQDEPDLVFCGRLIAEVFEQTLCPDDDDLPFRAAPTWTRLRLYQLTDDRWVVVAEDLRALRRVRRQVEVCAGVAELVGFLGYTDLAKALYQRAGIDARKRIGAEGTLKTCDSLSPTTQEAQARAQAERSQGDDLADMDSIRDDPVQVAIVDREAVELRLKTAEKAGYRRQVAVLEQLRESGFERGLAQVEPAMLSRLRGLEAQFPNFAEVIAYLHCQLALCLLAARPALRLLPLLLTGAPGIGKTRFVKELAELLGAEFHVIACNTTTASFVLSGADSQWHEAKPGRIFQALVRGRSANPVMLLDEVDKMSSEARYDPYGPLYSLLEPHTAKRFIDEYVALELDASHIVWVAAANDTARIPEPILSRFRVLSVAAPTRAQMAAVARSVYRDLLATEPWGSAFAAELPGCVLDRLINLSPRLLRLALLDALGRAALRAGMSIAGSATLAPSPDDIERALALRLPGGRRPLGFTWEETLR